VVASDFKIDVEKHVFGNETTKSEINYSVAVNNEIAQTVMLAINVNEKGDRKEATELFKKTIDKTFKTVGVDLPLPVSEAIGYGKSKFAETKVHWYTFKLDKDNTETGILMITSK